MALPCCPSWRTAVHDDGVGAFRGRSRAKFDALSHAIKHIMAGVNVSCQTMHKIKHLGMIYPKFLSSGALSTMEQNPAHEMSPIHHTDDEINGFLLPQTFFYCYKVTCKRKPAKNKHKRRKRSRKVGRPWSYRVFFQRGGLNFGNGTDS